MARLVKPLTDTEIKNAKAKLSDYTLHDGDGLQLQVKTSGRKSWDFRYSRPVTKKRARISFGPYPEITLAYARKLRAEARTLIAKGIDPTEYRRDQIQKKLDINANTFSLVARSWWEVKKTSVTEDYAKDIWRSLEKDVLPSIGHISITEIKARTLIKAIEPVQARGALETVRRLSQRINEIMIFAMNTGLIDSIPSATIGKAFEKPKKEHMLTIRPEQLPELMHTMMSASITLTTKYLFTFQLLTLTRPSEASSARWEEIDLDNKIWTIPACRMKMNRTHIIPLSNQVLSLLELMKPISGHKEYIFTSRINRSEPMNSQSVNAALKRAGYGGVLVSHGLRSIGSTALNEEGFPSDIIEAALAHVDKNEVRRAYNRSDYLEHRRPMMQWWADFISNAEDCSLKANKIK